MRRLNRCKKFIAAFCLFFFAFQLLAPVVSFALTTGPAQPEMQKFEPAGVTDMVDLFSGDMKYNIPLLDVGGYPVNLSYQSGAGIEEEASWVGTGWSLNPGAVNRSMRGLPDDFNGDEVKKTFYTKPFKKVGGAVNVKTSLFGWEFGKAQVELGIYKDNYYGIGASVGAGVSFQLSVNTKTSLNAGLNLLSDTRGGVDVTPNVGIETQFTESKESGKAGLSGGFKYNTREGLKSMSLTASFSPANKDIFLGNSLDISYEKNFGQTYTPTQTVEKKNKGFTFTFDIGGIFTGGYGGVGGKGYTYREEIINNNISSKAYGYLNYLKGRRDVSAMIDFNREKDAVFIKGTPAIATPVPTYDYFNVTAQTGSQQFRPFFGGNYVVFDKKNSNVSDNNSFGVTVGFGSIFQAGGNINLTNGGSNSGKWTANNNYLSVAETNFNTAALEEPVYIKQVGEKTLVDNSYLANIGGERANQVVINGSGGNAITYAQYKYRGNGVEGVGPIKRYTRDKRVAGFSYLSAEQASRYGLDKTINGESRMNSFRKAHHMSEAMVTDNEGKRMVYGIPVYNKKQNDITFSVKKATNYEQARKTGIYTYTPGVDDKIDNKNGRDHFYSKEEVPGYATGFLLTGILSPDYIDKTGNGISDDDPGSAVKFKYTRLASDFNWRAPYGTNKANYNEGFMSDHLDDKASISYGEKEVWYLQSVESKTMIAIFETSDREDGLGVSNEQGALNSSVRLKKLDKITLYSKADWVKNGTNATPVKIVKLTYDYSLWQNTPNVVAAGLSKGKLTLKKVTFEFGRSTRGLSNPYEFEYDLAPVNPLANTAPYSLMDPLEKDDKYSERQSDRWGTYKQGFYNRTKTLGGGTLQPLLNNSEFPYVAQVNVNTTIDEKAIADRFASKWQLTTIKTPSSGVITVTYESDEYAYVQNRKAMQMCFIKGVENSGQSTGLIAADRLVIELPRALSSGTPEGRKTEFKEKYLSMGGGKYHESIFYKVLTNMNNSPGKDEYVHGYAEINWTLTDCPDATTVRLGLKKIKPDQMNEYFNPVSISAWQMLRSDLPQYAYDNYDNLEVGDGEAAIRAIVQAIANYITELGQPFEKRASRKKFADWINIEKSMVRLTNPYNAKIGGGVRVKKVQISDEWNVMAPGNTVASYGQEYDYAIRDNSGNFLESSGVASYEPQIGNEENPFHEPINFAEKVHWGNDKYHFVEKPFCESYFPAPTVGYSKVRVTSFGVSNEKQTGYIDNEFFTAKEFPTMVEHLTLDSRPYENNLTVRLFSSTSIDKMVASQGFKIELNDMHGKPKLVKVFSKGGDLISSTEYKYNVKDERAEWKELDNVVDVMASNGSFSAQAIGVDVDYTTDVRESVSYSSGDTFGASAGVTLLPPFPIIIPPFIFIPPFPIPFAAPNYNHTSFTSKFNSISAVKVVHKYGLVKKVITTQHGSTIEAENLLWDGETGEVLLTRTQNEYEKWTYAFNYPTHYVTDYEGMGAAYKNLGTTFTSFVTGSDGKISSMSDAEEKACLFPGDELVFLGTGDKKGWIIKGPLANASVPDYRLIDDNGDFISTSGSWLLLRSGRRNMLTGTAGSVVTMNDPRTGGGGTGGGQILLDVSQKILDSKAIEYKDEWAVPVTSKGVIYQDCGGGSARPVTGFSSHDSVHTYTVEKNGLVIHQTARAGESPSIGESCSCLCLKAFFDYLINTQQLFITQGQNITVGQLKTAANGAGYNVGSCPILDNNLTKPFYALTTNSVGLIYTAKIGDCIVSIRSNQATNVNFYSLVSQACGTSPVVNYSGTGTQTINQTLYSDYNQMEYVYPVTTVCNVEKLKFGEATYGAGGQLFNSQFRMPGITQIPANATITSANLYLYAHPGGFDPKGGFTDAHKLSSGMAPGQYLFLGRPNSEPSPCNFNGFTASISNILNVTNPFQDFVFDVASTVTYMKNNGKAWFILRNWGDGGGGDPATQCYGTFCSHTYPDPAKRPRLELTYTIPAGQPNIATLSIDECNSCADPVGNKINPYYAGVLGNWRPLMNYVYTVNRDHTAGNPTQVGGTDIRNSGYYTSYNRFWTFQGNGLAKTGTPSDSRWVWGNRSVYYDQKGNELESVDALSRYGSALFGYKQSVATAVAANARNNEIAFDGFEDYDFDLETGSGEACPMKRHLDLGFVKQNNIWTSPGGTISSLESHTGKYSYKLNGATNITRNPGLPAPPSGALLSYDAMGRYLLNANELAKGFAPVNGKNYLFSCWIYDGSPNTTTLNGVTITVNGVGPTSIKVVEGWKRVEIPFTGSSSFTLNINGSDKYVDDVRIFPFDGQMNSYVYDDRTMRLLAQLDENNFATLYEYDDEGTPVRVKKETEKGIMTLKENRQSLRKRN